MKTKPLKFVINNNLKRLIFLGIVLVSFSALLILWLGGFLPGLNQTKELARNEQSYVRLLDFDTSERKIDLVQEHRVSLLAVGDIMLSRVVADKMRQKGNDYPFLNVADFLRSADIVFGNLESPITEGRRIVPYEMRFRADPGSEIALRKAGFNVMSLANNHTPDFGAEGIVDTLNYLKSVNIAVVGAGETATEAFQPIYLSKNGITFAFLAYNDSDVVPAFYGAGNDRAGTALMDIERLFLTVKKAKQKADFVIVSMHAGDEYSAKSNESQVNFARKAVDAGADIVIGHHPHVVQPMEQYKGRYIFYSLGNFVFDQLQPDTKEGLIVKIIFSKQDIADVSFYPILIGDLSQPEFAKGGKVKEIMDRLLPSAD